VLGVIFHLARVFSLNKKHIITDNGS
jgi:hypothetical protein